MSRGQREKTIAAAKPRYLLETFYAGQKTCDKVLANVATADNFILDSGAFSFLNGTGSFDKRRMDNYVAAYAEYINSRGISQYIEMDIDAIVSLDYVEGLRREIEEETGRKSIPVWHKTRGVNKFIELLEEYDYIAIGGFAIRELKQSEYPAVLELTKYARRRNVKVHGLGFTRTKDIERWPFFSVDSSTASKAGGRGKKLYTFTGSGMASRGIDGNGKKVKLEAVIAQNTIEWCKYQRYMDTKKW